MTLDDVTQILTILDAGSKRGVGLLTLSRQSGVPANTLRAWLPRHKSFVVKVPASGAYTINRFGKYKGNIVLMIDAYRDSLETKRQQEKSTSVSSFPFFF